MPAGSTQNPPALGLQVYSAQECGPAPVGAGASGTEQMMEIIQGLLGAVLTFVALVVIMGLIAALFMIIFGIATGIDEQIQE